MKNLKSYIILMRFNKPIGTLLLLWPTLWALWFAGQGAPAIKTIIIFTLGVIIMRAAGCIINDFADRHYDSLVKRTKNRPLANASVKPRNAMILFSILLLIALGLVLLLNHLTIYLAAIGALLAIIYPFSKRVLQAPQFILGLAFAWGIPMAFAAILNTVPWQAWGLFIITALWIIAYDTEYAMCDREDDLKIGIHSTAIWFGSYEVVITIWLQLLTVCGLIVFGFLYRLNLCFYLSIIVSSGLFSYQILLIKSRDPDKCFKAFLNNHWVGLVVFVGVVLGFR